MRLGYGVEKDSDEKNLVLLPGIESGFVGSSSGTILAELCWLPIVQTMTALTL